MSIRSDLFADLRTQCILYGVIAVVEQAYDGAPEPLPVDDAPIVVMDVDEPEFENLTMGTAGIVSETYNVTLRLYLGAEDMTQADAVAAQYAYADKFRAVFTNLATFNRTLETLLSVFATTPLRGTNNLKTYRSTGEAPYLEYTLQITEHRARNAAAS